MADLHSTTFENQLIELDSVDSTNNYAMARIQDGTAKSGYAYLAYNQTAGKGQRGKSWVSEPGQNLSISLVLQPDPIPLTQQFLFSAAVALGILDLLKNFEKLDWTIKWPNDIYWGDRKAAGILIENVIQGQVWKFAVIGIGLNLNQVNFPEDIPNAISIAQITGRRYSIVEVAGKITQAIQSRINSLRQNTDHILVDFNKNLYKKNQFVSLKRNNSIFQARIEQINHSGGLCTNQGTFMLGEVEWLVNR